jgi:hypothetical protein
MFVGFFKSFSSSSIFAKDGGAEDCGNPLSLVAVSFCSIAVEFTVHSQNLTTPRISSNLRNPLD